jgi:hypothetical protein
MSMQATIGPTPKISVNVVPDAATAATMRALESQHRLQVVDLLDEFDLGVDDNFFADAAGHQLGRQGVQTATQLVTPAGQINAATATERASLGSLLVDWPVLNTRTCDANVAGTSSTVSPEATSCWDSR